MSRDDHELTSALVDWKDAGGPVKAVVAAIDDYINRAVQRVHDGTDHTCDGIVDCTVCGAPPGVREAPDV